MNRRRRPAVRRLTASIAVGATLAGVVGTGVALAAPSPTPSPSPSASATVSSSLAAEIAFMREEERMARDLYAALAEAHDGATPMSRITTSEQRHFDAVGRLITTFGLTDPSTGRAPGTYAYDELTTLYASLYEQGKASLDGAYAAGVAVETTDIADLQDAIAASDNATVDQVFSNLLRASEQHLRAFRAADNGTTAGRGSASGGANAVAWGRGAGQRGHRGGNAGTCATS